MNEIDFQCSTKTYPCPFEYILDSSLFKVNVFYRLFAGAPESIRRALRLASPDRFHVCTFESIENTNFASSSSSVAFTSWLHAIFL